MSHPKKGVSHDSMAGSNLLEIRPIPDPNAATWKVITEEGDWHLVSHVTTGDVVLEHRCKRTAGEYMMVMTNPDGLCYLCHEQAPEGMLAVWKLGNM